MGQKRKLGQKKKNTPGGSPSDTKYTKKLSDILHMSQILRPQVSILPNLMAVGPTLTPSPGPKNANWDKQRKTPLEGPLVIPNTQKG